MLQRIYSNLTRILWVLFLLLLPITSLPLLSRLAGSTTVAPPSAVIALLLAVFVMLPAWLRGKPFPSPSLPLLAFVMAALISCVLAFFLDIPSFKEIGIARNMLEALFTLGIGICIYLTAAALPANHKNLQSALRWINWGGLFILLWSLAQIAISQGWTENYSPWAYDLQKLVSTSHVGLYPGRVTGLAYEPSWLAHQLNMLYLPLWLAASVQRLSAHRFRLWFLTFENLLLAGGVIVLWFSLSRVGLAAFLLMLGYLFLSANAALVRKVEGRFLRKYGEKARRMLVVGITLALILMYVLLIAGAAFGLSRIDPRMASLFDLSTLQQEGILAYTNRMFFAERVVFWQAGWKVFNEHPIIGVGLGNAGYHFPETMSDYGLRLIEVNDLLSKSASLPNTKSLWVRLLAETGIVGFALFITWLFVLWAGTGRLRQSTHPVQRIVALAARFVLLGLLIEGFSVDTFALPYFWVTFGLLTAALAVPKIGSENPERLNLDYPDTGQ